jgi:hypothetical protein
LMEQVPRKISDAPGELDRDIQNKMFAKYDSQQEQDVIHWIEAVLGVDLKSELHAGLKNGVVLCQFLNAMEPGAIPKINEPGIAFKERENISIYLETCKKLGMNKIDLFDAQDLYDDKSIVNVITHFYTLSGFCRNFQSFKGPFLDGGISTIPKSLNVPEIQIRKFSGATASREICRSPDQKKVYVEASEDGILGSLERDIQNKLKAKYDPKKEQEVKEWIEAIVERKFEKPLSEELKSGIIVCELLNRIWPGAVASDKIHQKLTPFNMRENITAYLESCKVLGMSDVYLFDTDDLFLEKNMISVVDQFVSLSHLAKKVQPEFKGPHIN